MNIPNLVDSLCNKLARKTKRFAESKTGGYFQLLVLFGPASFLPTVYQAWPAPNIDVLRTWTWPAMFLINAAGFFSIVQKGDWRIRIVMATWIVVIAAVCLAILIR